MILTNIAFRLWIRTKDKLPPRYKYVLGLYESGNMAVVCWFDNDEDLLFWRAMCDDGWESDCDNGPDYWMPLPLPPEENEI